MQIHTNILHIPIRARAPHKAGKAVYLNLAGQSVYIEELALAHYTGLGCTGIHAENNYWLNLLQIYLWDIVRLPVRHPEIDGPVGAYRPDYYKAGFYQRHRRAIDETLRGQLSGWRPEQKLQEEFQRRHTVFNGKPDLWGKFSIADYCLVPRYLKLDTIAAIFTRILDDPRCRKGLPDLFLIANGGNAAFVEIKAKTEKVSAEQLAWMRYLQKLGFPVEVCRVIPEPTSTAH